MHDDVGAVLDGTNQIGSAESVVYDQRQSVAVSHIGHGAYVDQVAVGITESLDKQGLCRRAYRLLEIGRIRRVDKCGGHAVDRQSIVEQIVSPAIDSVGGHDMIALRHQPEYGIGHGSGAGRQRQNGHAAFESGHALLEHILGGIGEPAVDVALLLEIETGRSLGRAAENIGCGLVHRYRAGIGGRIGMLLPHMELHRLEM